MTQRQDMVGWQRQVVEALQPFGHEFSFPRNSLIYTPEQSARSLYVLCSGQVHLSMISPGGRSLTLLVVEPVSLFGHSVLAGSQTYDAFAEAARSARALEISREGMIRALSRTPGLGLSLVEELEQYVLAVSRRLDEVAFKSVSARLASVLLNMVEAPTTEQQLRLPRRTHQQLADMTNAYRETVTKIIKQFRADKLLDIDRSGITLLNTSRLRELAQGECH